MKSIERSLKRTLTWSIAGLMVLVLLAVDLAVDSWSDQLYEKSKQGKFLFLQSEVQQNGDELVLRFSHQTLPEFDGYSDPEYYQVWSKDKVVAKSPSLGLFEIKELPYQALALGETKKVSMVLPDGRKGYVLYSRYKPDSIMGLQANGERDVVMAYAASSQSLEFVQWIIDVAFILACLFVIVFIRLVVGRAVNQGLKPLNELGRQVKRIDFSKNTNQLILDEAFVELTPIVEGVNHFIIDNRKLYSAEKRLTSDIAHELKTPIAELMNLSQVLIRFPNDAKISQHYAEQVLSISERLHLITNSMIFLYRGTEGGLQKKTFKLDDLIQHHIKDKKNCYFVAESGPVELYVNYFSLSTIVSNLIDNALTYRKPDTPLVIKSRVNSDFLDVRFENQVQDNVVASDLADFFTPLWQKDSARSSTKNFGLGLTIVKECADAIDADIQISLIDSTLSFCLSIKLK